MSSMWKCENCKKPLQLNKGVLDKGGTTECVCGQEIRVEKKKNGKIKISQRER